MTDPVDLPQNAELELRERLTVLERWRENTEPILATLTLVALLATVTLLTLTLKRRSR